MATETDKKNHSNILETARQRFDFAVEYEYEQRANSLEDLEFSDGDQWHPAIKNDREADNRPTITINKVNQHIKQITNDQRQNRPAINVHPVDDKADVDTAKILKGIIRHIEYSSDADTAYDTAFDGAVRKGFGYFRVTTEYVSPFSFEQEIKIKKISNSFNVYLDPFSQEPDGSDAEWGCIFETISKEKYNELYPKSKLTSMDDWASLGNNYKGWMSDESCRVAEYYYKVYEDKKIYLLSNGETVDVELTEEQQFELGVTIVDERETRVPKVKWCIHNGYEILDEGDWVGTLIPIVQVLGEELDIDGKRVLNGVVKHAKDSQRMYNYWASTEAEMIMLAPKAPFIGAEGQFEGYEDEWSTANQKTHGFLQYKATTVDGQLAPPPQRNMVEPPVMAITQARMQASEDLKSTTGIYDAALGNRSNETSGVAIQRRNIQAQTSNFHFIDNLTRSMKHLGRILVEMIPIVYDTPRVIRIIGEDDEQEIVKINQIFQKKNGQKKIYDTSMGKYDVTVSTGPSFTTKRQEAVESMLSFIKAYPNAAPYIGDLFAKNMDWPGAQEISERLKKTLPPNIIDSEDQEPIPAQVQNQMAEMTQMIEQLTQKLNEANEDIKTKSIERESEEKMKLLEIESRERIKLAEIEADLQKEYFKAGAKDSNEILKAEMNQINQRQEQDLNFNEPIIYDQNRPDQPQLTNNNNLTGEVPPGTFVEE